MFKANAKVSRNDIGNHKNTYKPINIRTLFAESIIGANSIKYFKLLKMFKNVLCIWYTNSHTFRQCETTLAVGMTTLMLIVSTRLNKKDDAIKIIFALQDVKNVSEFRLLIVWYYGIEVSFYRGDWDCAREVEFEMLARNMLL